MDRVMITAHIASIYGRQDSLLKVIRSIYSQVDAMFVALNSYPEVPKWMSQFPKCHAEIFNNSLKDCAKFLFIHETEGLCLVWDDDLVMPEGCVDYLVRGQHKYGGVVGFHGRKYPRPIIHFRKWTANYRCLGNVAQDVSVDVLGTGCMLFDNRGLKVDMSVFEYPGMADLTFARLSHKQNVPLTVLAHRSDLLSYIVPETTLWRSVRDFSVHTRLLNEFLLPDIKS